MIDDRTAGPAVPPSGSMDNSGGMDGSDAPTTGDGLGGDGRRKEDGGGGTAGPAVRNQLHKNSPAVTDDRVHKTRRNLPHWQVGRSTYFLTYRCVRGVVLSEAARSLVLDNWMHWHGKRYLLHALVVMPDHVHALITPLKRDDKAWFALDQILHTTKSFTAHAVNKATGRKGHVWQEESFDRIVRDENEFREKWNYMANNPVKAGLSRQPEEYPWWYQAPRTAGPAAPLG